MARLARALALVVLLTTACTADDVDAAHIIVPGELGTAGIIYRDAPAGRPYTVGDLIICLDRPGRVTVTGIEQEDVNGSLRLTDFALIPNAMETGGEGFANGNRPIDDLVPPGPYVLDKPCPDVDSSPPDPQMYALVLEYRKTSAATAGNAGIVIHYESDGKPYWVPIPWTVRLCAPGDTSGDCGFGATPSSTAR